MEYIFVREVNSKLVSFFQQQPLAFLWEGPPDGNGDSQRGTVKN